jgi:uncharacterized damage-inducible protein DinB
MGQMGQLEEAWRKNNLLNRALLDIAGEERLALAFPKSKSIRAHFAHIVNVRRMKLKMSARDLLDNSEKADRRRSTAEELRADLASSGEAIAKLIERAGSPAEKIRGSGLDATNFVVALVAHEANHRAQVEATLRVLSTEISDEQQLRISDWAKL